GLAFGEIVSERAKRTAIQVERASEKDGLIVLWEIEPNETATWVARALSEHFSVPLKVLHPSAREESECHSVRCAIPGEPLFVNGSFVGVVETPEVRAYIKDGRIVRIEGVSAKEAGLERLGRLDGDVKFKSGYIRYKARACDVPPVRYGKGTMAIIDHIAFSSLESIGPETVCALTVGDDTTEVAGDILARRGVRIIGITDGDRDGVLKAPVRASGSIIFKVKGVTDDEAGAALAAAVAGTDTFEGFVEKVKAELGRMGVSFEVCQ
ncbi:MAG TPA: DUF2117 domain-containing protein, partial [Methanocella sp.]|nr:DUF2117 domain-containing protein [Methanocella sp.]